MPEPEGPSGLFYQRLDVEPEASHEEIVHAYRRLAHRAHPDVQPGDPDAPRRFRELTEAYEVLGDPGRRASYDRAMSLPAIRVVVRPSAEPARGSRWPAEGISTSERMVVLGSTGRLGDVPLRVGPVRVDHDPQTYPEAPPGAGPGWGIVQLLSEILDSWSGS